MGALTREIGSEFHKMAIEAGHGLSVPVKGPLVFSGRTAIETVLKEMPDARKALLPSYCCDSMIEPFRKVGIEVNYYPVNYEDGGLKIDADIPEDVNIFLWCNYFGFKTPMPDMANFVIRGGVIIEDVTHSILSDQPYHQQSQYLVASLRKWEPVNCGGYCAKVNGKLQHEPTILPPEEFTRLKMAAMEMKAAYLLNLEEEKKPQYLQMFGDSNYWLAKNYSGLAMDLWSHEYLSHVDTAQHKKVRRNNAKTLYKGLKGKVQFLFPEKDMDCPLFVPILLQNREEVRKKLTDNKIYCPVHWPNSESCESNLYEVELSLICDQRYVEEDMKRVISVLKEVL